MSKRVWLNLSVPVMEAELKTGYESGELVTVLVFVSILSFLSLGTVRYLILRRVDNIRTR